MLNQKGVAHILVLVAAVGIIGFLFISNTFDFKDNLFGAIFPKPSSHASGAINYYGKDISFFGLFGQKDIKSATRNKVAANSAYHGSGVVVDTSSTPNKLYMVDSGNSRILGFNGTDGINKPADIVIGQPDFSSGNCNGDSNLGFKNKPTASTLCLMSYPEGNNTAEQWAFSNIAIDSVGNLYVPDKYNNRILRYNQPFSLDKTDGKGDGVADFVWGQPDFTSNTPNQSGSFYQINAPTNNTLRLSHLHGSPTASGVSIDPIDGGLWVADTGNHRMLHFAQNSKTADIVLGQPNMTSDNCNLDPTNKQVLCAAIVAQRDPSTGELYVIDIWPESFKTRILVYKPDANNRFQNGQAADRVFKPNVQRQAGVNDWMFTTDPAWNLNGNTYIFRATGLNINKYKQGDYASGVIWVNEHSDTGFGIYRTLLLDGNGNVVKVFGAKDQFHRGGDSAYIGCDVNIYQGNRIWWTGGSIGMDNNNNLYFADETQAYVTRYPLPYNTYTYNGATCLPDSTASFLDKGWNVPSNDTLDEWAGLAVFGNQLIVGDRLKFKVWNDYKNKDLGAPADIVVQDPGRPGRNFFSDAIDDNNRLWTKGEHHQLQVYQLPFTNSTNAPIGDYLKLYWADDNTEVDGGLIGSIAFDRANKALYIAKGARVLRVRNYNEYSNKLYVDMVIGQRNKTNISCNQGLSTPNAETICIPIELKFDKLGNLYVVDAAWECNGNSRITVFMADDLRNAQGMFPNLQAKKVFSQPNLTSKTNCAYWVKDAPGTPITVAFNSKNQMVVGNDGYYGDIQQRELKQLWFYSDPINKQTPDASISLYMGTPAGLAFDNEDNLLVYDGTWYRVAMINLCKDPDWLEWLPGVNQVSACETSGGTNPTSTPVAQPLPTATPIATNQPSVIQTPFKGSPISLPGKVEAEDYDLGGEGIAYHDVDGTNNGGQYRVNEAVDLQTTADDGGYIMGWISASEWDEYTVNVATGGTYTVQVRVASPGDGGNFHIEFNGVNRTGSIHVPDTGGWDTWTTVSIPNVTLLSGTQVLRVVWDSNGSTGWVGNLNWINIVSSTTQPVPTPTVVPTVAPRPTSTPVVVGDSTAPTITITSPQDGGVVARNSRITLSATALDNIGVTKVEFRVDGNVVNNDFSAPFTYQHKLGGKPNAVYTITATAFDSAGNSASDLVTVLAK